MPRWVPRALLLAFALVVTLLAGRWLLHQLRGLVIILLVSLFLSFAMEPAVNRLAARGLRRGLATAVVMLGGFLLIAGFLFAVGSLLVDQVRLLIDNAPERMPSSG
jgi:predicted PurR-regulated permease PerM